MMNENAGSGHTYGSHSGDPHSGGPESGAEASQPGAITGLSADIPGAAPGKVLAAEAVRALMEADARRKAAPAADLASEVDGRGGEEPTRYGDWEKKGLAIDF